MIGLEMRRLSGSSSSSVAPGQAETIPGIGIAASGWWTECVPMPVPMPVSVSVSVSTSVPVTTHSQ
jgi:hypothetical protein